MFNAGSDPADLLITPLLGSSGLNDVVRAPTDPRTGNAVLPWGVGQLSNVLLGDCREASFSVAKTAILASSCLVAFVGDSVTENCNAIDEDLFLRGNYRDVVMRAIRDAFPACTFTERNYGLSGRVGSLFISGTYVGQAVTEVPATGFLRPAVPWWGDGTGSTVGKTWKDHVKDSAPDVLFVAFGQNAETDSAIYAHLNGIKSEIAAWPKVPSVVCVSTFQPSAVYTNGRIYRRIGRAYRYFAKANGWGLLDVARVQSIFRDGADEATGNWKRAGTAGSWEGFYTTAGTPVSVSDSVTNFPPNAYLAYPVDAHNVSITVTADLSNSTVNGRLLIHLRDESAIIPSSAPPVGVWAQWTSSSVKIFDGVSEIATAVYVGAAATECRVDVVDNTLKAYVNGVEKVSAKIHINQAAGRVRIGSQFGSTGPLVCTAPSIIFQEPARSAAVITDDLLFGTYASGDVSTKLPYGGNGANHPSSVGISALFSPCVAELIRALQSAVGV